MVLTWLIYASRPIGYNPLELDDILHVSRARNAHSGITGALVSRWDLFLQVLEGPAAAVDETYARIRRDRRHVEVTLLGTATTPTRLFPDWTMRSEIQAPGLWSHADVLAGRHRAAPFGEALGIFERVSAAAPSAGRA